MCGIARGDYIDSELGFLSDCCELSSREIGGDLDSAG